MRKLLFLLCFISPLLFAQTASNELTAKLMRLQTMQADFLESVTANGRNISKSHGKMAMKRPGLFYWKIEEPLEKLVVADGKKIWMYDVELEQVTVKPLREVNSGMSALFLSDNLKKIDRDFNITKGHLGENDVFFLSARSEKSQVRKLNLTFHGTLLKKIELFDNLGQVTEIKFQKVNENIVINRKLFLFEPPKDVDVISE